MKNTFVKVLSFLMALTMIVGMFSAITVSAADECTHTKGEVVKTVAPTCEENGYTLYTCAECGEQYIPADTIVLAGPAYHDYEETEAKAATCLAPAYTAGKQCKICEGVPANGGVQAVANSQLQHNFKRVKVEATCTDGARYENVCSLCGLTAEKIQEKFEDGDTAWVAPQTYDAFKAVAIEDEPAMNPDHADLVWEVVTSPKSDAAAQTCTDGLLKGTCENCDYVEEKIIPVAHDFSIDLNPNHATCLPYVSGTQCSVCKAISADAVLNEEVTEHADADNAKIAYTNVVVDPTNLPEKWDGVKFTFAELETLGFRAGDKLSKDNSCTEEGWVLTLCGCGLVYIATIPVDAEAHKDANLLKGDIKWPTLCTQDATRTDKCQNYATCGYEKTTVIVEAVATTHKIKTNVVDPTCEEGGALGYTEKYCENTFVANGVVKECAHGKVVDSNGELVLTEGKATPIKTDYKDALEHVWGTPYYKSGDCGSATYEKQCSVCEEKVEVAEPTGTQHVWVESTVAATCLVAEHTKKVCSICEKEVHEEPAEDAEVDPTNHVYDNKTLVATVKAATCTEKGLITIKCDNPECTGTAKNIEVDKLQHTQTQGSKLVVTEVETCDVEGHPETKHNHYSVETEKTPATCQAVGYKNDGKWCTVCGTQTKAPTEIAIDKNNHVDIINENVETINATCQSNTIVTMSTACCGLVKVEMANTKVADHVYVSQQYNAATCTKAGNHAYQACQWCKEYLVGSVTTEGCTLGCSNHAAIDANTTENYVIAALGHKWKEVAADPETCTENGTKKYFYCERCTVTSGEGDDAATIYNIVTLDKATIYDLTKAEQEAAFLAASIEYAHGSRFVKTFADEAKDATCTSTGIKAYKDANAKSGWCTKCEKDAWVIPMLDHTFTTQMANQAGSANYDCTKPSAMVSSCTKCGTVEVNEETGAYVYTFNAPAKTAHVFPETWTTMTLEDGKFTCDTDTKEFRQCENCSVKETRVKEGGEATGHYTTKGVEGDNAPKFFFDLSCDKIAEFKDMRCDVCGKKVGEDLVAKHTSITPVEKAETCLEDGYHIEFCTVCNEAVVNNPIDNIPNVENAKHEPYVEGVSTIVEYKAATPTENGYIVYICGNVNCKAEAIHVLDASANIVVSGELSAEEVVAGTTVEYTVSFAGANYEFDAIELNVKYDADLFTFVSVSTTLEGARANASVNKKGLGISIVVPYNADGEEQKASTTVEGTAVVTVVFQAKKYAVGEAEFDVEYLACACEAAEIEVLGLGNLNGDAYITVEDALAVSKKFATDDVFADINGDGIVDIDDFALVATFAVSDQTLKDYLVMLGTYGEIEATIEALYESGRLADVNRDNRQDINDYWFITLAIEEGLAEMPYDIPFGFESVEEFVMEVMTGLALDFGM